jgi:PAS domain S-box-containing protein
MAAIARDWVALVREVIDASPSGILVLTTEGRIVLANGAVERIFGYARSELAGHDVERVLPGAVTVVRAAAVHRATFDAGAVSGLRDLDGRRKDGSAISVETAWHAIEGSEGPLLMAFVVVGAARPALDVARPHSLEDRLAFERLVSELSGRFINIPLSEIDAAVRDALARVSAAMRVDRSVLYRAEADGALSEVLSWETVGCSASGIRQLTIDQFPAAMADLRAGKNVCFSTTDELPTESDREGYQAMGTRSAILIPLSVEGRFVGAVSFGAVSDDRHWTSEDVHRIQVMASLLDQVLARRHRDEALRRALAEVQRLKDDLQVENVQLREAVEGGEFARVVGGSAALQQVLAQIRRVAATDSTVLLLGETGTGKELFATQIHEAGARKSRAMVRVNCAAIPATLIESELFGREKGAFTGALARQVGRFELADRSTIFLDEIGDLPSEIQVKLLRVLEERRIERLGSSRSILVNTRIIAATHRDLERQITEGAFRQDLYYRLNVFPIRVPPLRERAEDIPLLVWRFAGEFAKAFGKPLESISRESLVALQHYAWPGNIRELRNVVERAMITATGPRLTIAPPQTSALAGRRSSRLVDVEREHIRSVLERAHWRVRGSEGAAESLGLKPTTLETRMAKLGLRRPS